MDHGSFLKAPYILRDLAGTSFMYLIDLRDKGILKFPFSLQFQLYSRVMLDKTNYLDPFQSRFRPRDQMTLITYMHYGEFFIVMLQGLVEYERWKIIITWIKDLILHKAIQFLDLDRATS